jgi:hypothetical protein
MENHFYSTGPRKDITINKSVLSSFIIEPGANTIILLNAVSKLVCMPISNFHCKLILAGQAMSSTEWCYSGRLQGPVTYKCAQ